MLAGDIGVGTSGIEWAVKERRRLQKPLIYVPGNHEYYQHDITQLDDRIRAIARAGDVYFLNENVVTVGGVRFLGATLWTDYCVVPGESTNNTMWHCRRNLADHKLISVAGDRFSPQHARRFNKDARAWIKKELGRGNPNRPHVVISHHAPSPQCQHPRYGMAPLSAAFVSDAEDLVERVDLWLYGHTHACFDEEIRGTRVVSNQRGYRYEKTYGFDGRKVITVPGTSGQECTSEGDGK